MAILHTKYDKLTFKERAELRARYVEAQQGRCIWCYQNLEDDPDTEVAEAEIDWELFPEGFMNSPVHLQHSHANGFTEGAVHAKCNAYMWQYHRR